MRFDNLLIAHQGTANREDHEIVPRDAKPGDYFWAHMPDLPGRNKWELVPFAATKAWPGSWKWVERRGRKRLCFHRDPDTDSDSSSSSSDSDSDSD